MTVYKFISKYLNSKVTKRHIRIYGEKLIFDVIRSKSYHEFNDYRRFKKYGEKTVDKYKRVKYNTFYDIKRAYFLWTTEDYKYKKVLGGKVE